MNEILRFKVCIASLENKIYRVVEILDRFTVADLAYTILASFNSLAYHLYNITYKGKSYDCWVCPSDIVDMTNVVNATITRLSDLGLKYNDKMVMYYDYGATTTFKIEYLDSYQIHKDIDQINYPCIVEGEGLGMMDDLADFELKEIVDETDEFGYSNAFFTPGYKLENKKFDYRKYNLRADNKRLKGLVLLIKNSYEIKS